MLLVTEATMFMPTSCRNSNRFDAPALEQRRQNTSAASNAFITLHEPNPALLASTSISTPISSELQSAYREGRQLQEQAKHIKAMWDDAYEMLEWMPVPSTHSSTRSSLVWVKKKTPQNLYMGGDLCLLTSDNTLPVWLTEDDNGYGQASFTQDEKWLAYTSTEFHPARARRESLTPDIPLTVYVQNLRTRQRKTVFREQSTPSDALPPSCVLYWLSQTASLFYASTNPPGLFLIDTDSGKSRRLTTNSPAGIVPQSHCAYWLDAKSSLLSIARLPASKAKWTLAKTWRSVKPTTKFVFPAKPECLTFSPNGRYCAALVPIGGKKEKTKKTKKTEAVQQRQLVVLDTVIQAALMLGETGDQPIDDLRWSQDGRCLLLCRWQFQSVTQEPQVQVVTWEEPVAQSFARLDWHNHRCVKVIDALVQSPFARMRTASTQGR